MKDTGHSIYVYFTFYMLDILQSLFGFLLKLWVKNLRDASQRAVCDLVSYFDIVHL